MLAGRHRGLHVSFAAPEHIGYASSNSSSLVHSDLQATVIEPVHVTVPLSNVPPEVLGVHQQAKQGQQLSRTSTDSSAGVVSAAASVKTGRTGLSQMLAAEKAKAFEVGLRINHPRQVTALPTKYHKALAWAGRVGWVGKAVVYSMIGGLACQSAVGDNRPDPNLPQTDQVAASPQGAFVLLGTTPGGVSIVILLVMMVALLAYITWRFWEGLAGQGYDETFSAMKNFFKFRVSPIVSGAVYVSYMVFLISLLDREVRHVHAEPGPPKEGWPATWRHSAGGRVGLALLGIAFIIATCIQLQGVLTRQWHKDYRSDLPKPLMTAVFAIGHFGFAGRAGAFLALAVLFFKDAGGSEGAPHNSSMVANALQQLQGSRGLRAVLMIVGLLLVLYGLFATSSAFTRMFPTPPPSRRKTLPATEYKQQQLLQHPELLDDVAQQQQHHGGGKGCLPWTRKPKAATRPTTSTADSGQVITDVGRQLGGPSAAAASGVCNGQYSTNDVSPYWGADQGLGRASPLDQQEAGGPSLTPGAGPAAAAAAGAPRKPLFVLPSQRTFAKAGAPAGAGGVAATRGGVQGREFVTIDL